VGDKQVEKNYPGNERRRRQIVVPSSGNPYKQAEKQKLGEDPRQGTVVQENQGHQQPGDEKLVGVEQDVPAPASTLAAIVPGKPRGRIPRPAFIPGIPSPGNPSGHRARTFTPEIFRNGIPGKLPSPAFSPALPWSRISGELPRIPGSRAVPRIRRESRAKRVPPRSPAKVLADNPQGYPGDKTRG